jgi:hypothetical protein
MDFSSSNLFGSRLHWGHAAIFYDALVATGSPARALQAHLTCAIQMNYADLMTRFNARSEATFVHSIEVQIPSRWIGLLVVAAILLVHMILLFWTTAWFLRSNDLTMLGNSWQAVAQVVSYTTNPILWDSTGKTDKNVNKEIERIGRTKDRVWISKNHETGRNEFVPAGVK